MDTGSNSDSETVTVDSEVERSSSNIKGTEIGSVSSKRVTGASSGKKKAAGAFKTISEVANELDVQQHVLRFWETKFSYVRPLKRGGGRRYYRPEDVQLLKAIHHLLYTDGYTIKGVQKMLREKGKNSVLEMLNPKSQVVSNEVAPQPVSAPLSGSPLAQKPRAYVETLEQPVAAALLSDDQKTMLRSMLNELKEIRNMIGSDDEQ